jgi:hypothetical protein
MSTEGYKLGFVPECVIFLYIARSDEGIFPKLQDKVFLNRS